MHRIRKSGDEFGRGAIEIHLAKSGALPEVYMEGHVHQPVFKIGQDLRANLNGKKTSLLEEMCQTLLCRVHVFIGIGGFDGILGSLEQTAVGEAVCAGKSINAQIESGLKDEANVDAIGEWADFHGDVVEVAEVL